MFERLAGISMAQLNHTVARLLNKLLIEQTKSRPRHWNDNGLVGAINGAVIRKLIGWGDIPRQHAEAVDRFIGRPSAAAPDGG